MLNKIRDIFHSNDFFRIKGDILLLYSRTYAWRKVKCVPLNVNSTIK